MNKNDLKLDADLRETIIYQNTILPLSVSIDHFDEYTGREWSCHWHEEFEFAYILSGSIRFTVFDASNISPTLESHKGDDVFINTGTLHSAKALLQDTTMAVAVFPMNLFQTYPFEQLYAKNIHPVISSGISHLLFHHEQNDDLLHTIRDLGSLNAEETLYELHCLELACRLWRLLSLLITEKTDTNDSHIKETFLNQRIQKMMSYVHSHYAEQISVNDIAASASVSRTECFRCFRMILKCTPVEYLLKYRLTMAASLLGDTKMTLSEISASCGFNSNSYFGKMFLKKFGLSPKKYRQAKITQHK